MPLPQFFGAPSCSLMASTMARSAALFALGVIGEEHPQQAHALVGPGRARPCLRRQRSPLFETLMDLQP